MSESISVRLTEELAAIWQSEGTERRALLDDLIAWREPALIPLLQERLTQTHGSMLSVLLEKLASYGEEAGDCVETLLALYINGTNSRKTNKSLEHCLTAIGAPCKEPILSAFQTNIFNQPVAGLLAVFFSLPSVEEELLPLAHHFYKVGAFGDFVSVVEEMGRQKVVSAAPSLFRWAQNTRNQKPHPNIAFDIFNGTLQALTELGQDALPYVAQMEDWLPSLPFGHSSVVLYAMTALGSFEGLVAKELAKSLPDQSQDRESRRKKSRKFMMILQGIKRSADTHFVDMLHEQLYLCPNEQAAEALIEAMVSCLARGMEPMELLAWVRQLLDAPPHPRLFRLLCALTNAVSEAERDLVLPYIDEHLDRWPLSLCGVTLTTSRSPLYKDNPWWLERHQCLHHKPSWPLVRSFTFNAREKPSFVTFVGNMLHQSEAMSLQQLVFHGLNFFKKDRFFQLLSAPLPKLKEIHFERCKLPPDWDVQLSSASWIEQISLLAIHGCRDDYLLIMDRVPVSLRHLSADVVITMDAVDDT